MVEKIRLPKKQKQEVNRHLEELKCKLSKENHINVNFRKLIFKD